RSRGRPRPGRRRGRRTARPGPTRVKAGASTSMPWGLLLELDHENRLRWRAPGREGLAVASSMIAADVDADVSGARGGPPHPEEARGGRLRGRLPRGPRLGPDAPGRAQDPAARDHVLGAGAAPLPARGGDRPRTRPPEHP